MWYKEECCVRGCKMWLYHIAHFSTQHCTLHIITRSTSYQPIPHHTTTRDSKFPITHSTPPQCCVMRCGMCCHHMVVEHIPHHHTTFHIAPHHTFHITPTHYTTFHITLHCGKIPYHTLHLISHYITTSYTNLFCTSTAHSTSTIITLNHHLLHFSSIWHHTSRIPHHNQMVVTLHVTSSHNITHHIMPHSISHKHSPHFTPFHMTPHIILHHFTLHYHIWLHNHIWPRISPSYSAHHSRIPHHSHVSIILNHSTAHHHIFLHIWIILPHHNQHTIFHFTQLIPYGITFHPTLHHHISLHIL